MFELVHCLDETTLYFSLNAAVFSWFHHSKALISSHNTLRWFFFFFKIINENYPTCFPKNLANRWNCLCLLLSRFSLFSPLFWLFLHLSLWIDAESRLYCCGTLTNTRLKHLHDSVFFTLWANVAPILRTAFSCPNFQSICGAQHFLKCLPCLLARTLLVDGHPIPFCEFSSPFLARSSHLVNHCNVRLGSSYVLV